MGRNFDGLSPIFVEGTVFTARRNARIASAVLAVPIPSLCLSVRLSHAGIVSKRLHVAPCSMHCPTATTRPASANRTARRQFQATGQPVSRTQASDAMTSRLSRYEAKCVQRRCFQWGRSLCVQTSRERSYSLPIYRYHSKGN